MERDSKSENKEKIVKPKTPLRTFSALYDFSKKIESNELSKIMDGSGGTATEHNKMREERPSLHVERPMVMEQPSDSKEQPLQRLSPSVNFDDEINNTSKDNIIKERPSFTEQPSLHVEQPMGMEQPSLHVEQPMGMEQPSLHVEQPVTEHIEIRMERFSRERQPFAELTERQARVLEYLKSIADPDGKILCISSEVLRERILSEAGVRLPSGQALRKTLNNMRLKGLLEIHTVRKWDNGMTVQGMEIRIRKDAPVCAVRGTEEGEEMRRPYRFEATALDLSQWPRLPKEAFVSYVAKYGIENVQEILDAVHYHCERRKDGLSPIRQRSGFLFTVLKQGYFVPDEGFVSRKQREEERLNRQRIAEERRIKELVAKSEEDELERFAAALTDDETAKIEGRAKERADVLFKSIGSGYKIILDMERQRLIREIFMERQSR